jgi:hypothetical protein
MDYGKRSVRTTINDIPTTVEDTIESFEQAYQNAQPFSYQRDWFEILIFFIALLFWTCIIFGLTWWARNKDPKEEARIQKLNRTMIPRCCDHVCPLDRPYIPNKTPFPWGRAFSSFFGIFLFMGAMLGITTFYDKPRTAQRKMCTASRALISCHTAYAQQMPLRLLKKVNPIKQAYHAADGKGPHSPEAIKHHSLLIMFYRTLKKASAPYYKPIKNPVYYGPP